MTLEKRPKDGHCCHDNQDDNLRRETRKKRRTPSGGGIQKKLSIFSSPGSNPMDTPSLMAHQNQDSKRTWICFRSTSPEQTGQTVVESSRELLQKLKFPDKNPQETENSPSQVQLLPYVSKGTAFLDRKLELLLCCCSCLCLQGAVFGPAGVPLMENRQISVISEGFQRFQTCREDHAGQNVKRRY